MVVTMEPINIEVGSKGASVYIEVNHTSRQQEIAVYGLGVDGNNTLISSITIQKKPGEDTGYTVSVTKTTGVSITPDGNFVKK